MYKVILYLKWASGLQEHVRTAETYQEAFEKREQLMQDYRRICVRAEIQAVNPPVKRRKRKPPRKDQRRR